jgi:hypothetical protein
MSLAPKELSPSALMNSMMGGMNPGHETDEGLKIPYSDTENDRTLMNEFCENLLGYWNGKYRSPKGQWDPATYAMATARIAQFNKHHVRRAYIEQLQLVMRHIFAPVLESLWFTIDKTELVFKVNLAWTQYIDVCDNLSGILKTLELKRGTEVRNGVNLYADPETDFRIAAVALFRSRLLELEPPLLNSCREVVFRLLNSESMSEHSVADNPLPNLVACFIAMHDCSSLYKGKKNRWANDRKSSESLYSLKYDIKPTIDEKALYCMPGGLEETLIHSATSWFLLQKQTGFTDDSSNEAMSRLHQFFSSVHPSTWNKVVSSLAMFSSESVQDNVQS